jgi:hypothetical protein
VGRPVVPGPIRTDQNLKKFKGLHDFENRSQQALGPVRVQLEGSRFRPYIKVS